MSNAVSAMNGASFKGSVTIKDTGLQGMITLRGDFKSAVVAKALKTATGTAMPETGQILHSAKGSAAWMSPDELLLLVDYTKVDAIIAKLDKALSGEHALVINVSDARAMFEIKGAATRDILAKGSPADMSKEGLPVGVMRRSRLGQLAVAFWMDDEKTAHMVCFRSVGEHVFMWLKNASEKGSLPKYYT
ncbi:sarcosine oxidase, gamma subunit family protein [Amylibacter sp. SFDW26]|uniref:sarcosine oxidase subunit gamma n=1 Tax=Amylibacter sp. SFDW26 TaxID=2652722 RepID=UPI0012617E59|nr:sarcosine oxidase subunit gamma family protein [Amylibacter sp. SFDW26]KAB7610294.1 sarcosine oxidase, gamma subunit family protein [Amylibacter sp. SFDW26]